MIAFGSLFLGLMLGAGRVDIVVTGSVVSVELRLDDLMVGKRVEPPWRFDVNFGDALEPHELVAVGFDAAGKEVERARQTINLPRPAAEATIVLEDGEKGKGRVARLNWQSTVAAMPLSVLVEFDGKDIPVSDGHRVELPDHDPEQLHFLRAELSFPDDIRAIAEIVFGGKERDETLTALTAVPVLLDRKGRKLLPPAALADWVVKGSQSLPVAAIEEGNALVVFVPDLAAKAAIDKMAKGSRNGEEASARYACIHRPEGCAGGFTLSDPVTLADGQRARVVWPVPATRQVGEQRYTVFDKTADFRGGVLWALGTPRWPAPGPGQQLASAVGAAALSALEDNRTRAVVLLLSAHPTDVGDLKPEIVRRYLATVGIPLFVWCVERNPSERVRSWGTVVDASSSRRFESAVKKLVENLERQRILWVEGTHLPQTLALSLKAKDIALLK